MAKQEKCRICLVKNNTKQLTNIYGSDGNIGNKIFLLSGIQVIDMLTFQQTAKICSSCLTKLQSAYEFRDLCIKSDVYFRKKTREEEKLCWNKNRMQLPFWRSRNLSSEDGMDHVEMENSDEDKPFAPIHQKTKFSNIQKLQASQIKVEIDDFTEVCEIKCEVFSEPVIAELSNSLVSTNVEKKSETCLCPICMQYFACRQSRNKHMRTIHKISHKDFKSIQCSECPKVFRTQTSLEYHVISQHNSNEGNQFTCDLCGKMFNSKTEIEIHFNSNSFAMINDKYPCPVCRLLFSHVKSRTRHLKKSHNILYSEPYYKCENIINSGSSTKQKSNIKQHVFTKKYSCSICKLTFFYEKARNSHMLKVHKKDVPLQCEQCGEYFKTKVELKNHKRKHKRVDRKRIEVKQEKKPCSICGKLVPSSGLKFHEKNHEEFDPSKYAYCDLCGNKFKFMCDLRSHIRIRHIQKKRYQCAQCPKFYFKNYGLQLHINAVHNRTISFNCEFCDKTFPRKLHLQSHLRTHTGETPYQCKYCEQKFRYNTDCRRHEWKHTGFKGNIKCPNCDERFFRSNELNSHLTRCYQRFV